MGFQNVSATEENELRHHKLTAVDTSREGFAALLLELNVLLKLPLISRVKATRGFVILFVCGLVLVCLVLVCCFLILRFGVSLFAFSCFLILHLCTFFSLTSLPTLFFFLI